LMNFAIEGGYMVVPAKLEFVAGYQAMDADNYDHAWSRTSIGVNYFFKKHDIKIQATYRMGENLNGKEDNDANEVFLQAQYVF
jgi:phosphate-selective porin OprO/OprP